MLKQRARDRIFKRSVGFLVVASMVALLFFLRMYQQASGPFKDTFRLTGTIARADGLEIDTPVTLAGLKVGRISHINIDSDNQIQLELEVNASYHDKLRQDSRASVNKPLIGSAFVDLSMGSPSKDILKDGAHISMSRSADLNDLVTTLPPKLEKIDIVLSNLVAASSSLNQITSSLAAQGGALDNSLRHIEKTTKQAAEAAGKVNETLNQTQKIITDTGSALTQVSGILADVKQGTERIPPLLLHVEQVLINAEALSVELKNIAPQLTQQLPPVISAGHSALNEADNVLRAAKNSFLLRSKQPPPATGPLPATSR